MTWVPLKVTVLLPRWSPKFFPLILTSVPTGPLSGVNDFSVGVAWRAVLAAATALGIPLDLAAVKGIPLLSCPTEVTTIRPPETPAGVDTRISRSLQ